MNPSAGKRYPRSRWCALLLCPLLSCMLSVAPAWAACPKLLMTAGLEIHKQTNPQQAAYWGDTVGVQGFMINYVVTDWQTDVGTKPDNPTWQLLRRFQTLYSKHGVTDNFIKIALYRGHDWHDAKQNQQAIRNMAHAAALARYAGVKGIALDLEPYKPAWTGSAGGPELTGLVEQEGRKIGEAMHAAYPGMTLIVLPDVLREVESGKNASHGGDAKRSVYLLAAPFVRGLLSVPWSHVVIATEFTYSAHAERIAPSMQQAVDRYRNAPDAHDALKDNFSIAPGLWPLGPTAQNKSARFSPEEFKRRLEAAFRTSKQYVWIYGSSSAWQTDGPFGKGPVAQNFPQFLKVIHEVRATCAKGGG